MNKSRCIEASPRDFLHRDDKLAQFVPYDDSFINTVALWTISSARGRTRRARLQLY